MLFHGATSDSIPKICEQGFNRSYSGKNATLFGRGVYFAADAKVRTSIDMSCKL